MDQKRHSEFLRIYVRNEESLRGYVRSLVPTLEDSRDVMQEIAVVLWNKFDTLPSLDQFRPWAFGVAKLEALQFLRKKSRDRHVFGDETLDLLAAKAENQSDLWEAERIALDHCLRKLPDKQRSLVQQAYAPDVRMDRLAASLGRTAMSLYKSLHRIRIKLIACTERAISQAEPS